MAKCRLSPIVVILPDVTVLCILLYIVYVVGGLRPELAFIIIVIIEIIVFRTIFNEVIFVFLLERSLVILDAGFIEEGVKRPDTFANVLLFLCCTMLLLPALLFLIWAQFRFHSLAILRLLRLS